MVCVNISATIILNEVLNTIFIRYDQINKIKKKL